MSCPAAVWLMDDLSFTIHSQPKPTSFPGLSPSRPYGERGVGENPGNEVEPKSAGKPWGHFAVVTSTRSC